MKVFALAIFAQLFLEIDEAVSACIIVAEVALPICYFILFLLLFIFAIN